MYGRRGPPGPFATLFVGSAPHHSACPLTNTAFLQGRTSLREWLRDLLTDREIVGAPPTPYYRAAAGEPDPKLYSPDPHLPADRRRRPVPAWCGEVLPRTLRPRSCQAQRKPWKDRSARGSGWDPDAGVARAGLQLADSF